MTIEFEALKANKLTIPDPVDTTDSVTKAYSDAHTNITNVALAVPFLGTAQGDAAFDAGTNTFTVPFAEGAPVYQGVAVTLGMVIAVVNEGAGIL